MGRVVFVFMSEGGSAANETPTWNPKAKGSSRFLENGSLASEGLVWMLEKMKEYKIIDDLLLIIEANKPENTGRFELNGNLGFVVPHISCVEELLRPNDILFIRGGFRGWHDWLKSRKRKNWLLLYAANTGRERWNWWDVILHDLPITQTYRADPEGRFWFPFRKPTNENIFRPLFINPTYDFCIGASFIHDKKGQWRTIEALSIYKKKYKKVPYCIMPGAPRHGTCTSPALEKASGLGVIVPGMVNRSDLNIILNSSKFFVHLGTSGQNDRGPIEAMRCGCRLIIATPSYHSPLVTRNPMVCYIPEDKDNFEALADSFNRLLKYYKEEDRGGVLSWYDSCLSEEKVLRDMDHLFYVLKNNTPSSKPLVKEFIK